MLLLILAAVGGYFIADSTNIFADGGVLSDNKVNVYVKQTSKDYFGDYEGTSKSKNKRWFKVNGVPLSRKQAEEFAYPYKQRYGTMNVRIENRRNYPKS
jgi:hypothetical protein